MASSYPDSTFAPRLAPNAQATTPRPTGANAAHCRSGGHPPVDLIPAGAGQSAPLPASAGSAPRPTVAPYHCDACGASSPYIGRKPVRKGGNDCKACNAVEKEINRALSTAMRAITAEAYRNNLIGDAKIAVMKRGEQAGREAWRAAQISFGIDLGREDRLALAAALTNAGHELINAGQDMALAAEGQVAA